jgi:hypothetical protein
LQCHAAFSRPRKKWVTFRFLNGYSGLLAA